MANTKIITLDWCETAKTVYAIVRREVDKYKLNDVDGNFASAPVDPYISLTEDSIIKGRYERSETRTVWNDGRYTVAIYKQSGGSPAPTNDTIIGSGELTIKDDSEVYIDVLPSSRLATLGYTPPDNATIANIQTEVATHPTLTEIEASTVLAKETTVSSIKAKTDTINWPDIIRLLGLSLENHVEDDIVRNNNGNKTSSMIYYYDTNTNAILHDKTTGIVGKLEIVVTYDNTGNMTSFKGIKR